MEILMGVLVGIFLLLIWGMVCNERTCRTRMKIITSISGRNLYDEFRFTWYNDHLLYIATFRDWRNLYDASIIQCYDEMYNKTS